MQNPRTIGQAAEHLSLAEAVDRVLNKGAVISGDVTISVADVELVRLDLQLVLAATERLLSMDGQNDGGEQRGDDRDR